MDCPKCNHKTKIIDVESEGLMTYRLHKCPNCSYRFYTSEEIDSNARYELSRIHSEQRARKKA